MRLGSSEIRGCSGHEAGRKLLEALYREETGEALPNILLSVRGKPFFENSPYHFSISHTDRHAFCALSRRPVGIDAEELDRAVRFSLVSRILSPASLFGAVGAERGCRKMHRCRTDRLPQPHRFCPG